ncbi:uncharacterized protein LOC126888355 isoform X2 [Diabrotica virgifera virgifera]|uniref:Uncharacterized protein n=1 Tax=Diabrotica virgifera virgifera TaxID=50390 RepID=A0ABM5KQM4_DIAVI|nr:uncharacterized protein LOC126888355 isoform X2 [Diabrotica virgifera virgifera]
MPMKFSDDVEKTSLVHIEALWNFLISNNFGKRLFEIKMSRPMNMLRTRRKDCNVKPNRRDNNRATRLDRKSSRGMIYENEELRLKTININAEVESRQSDIKKLKKENEMLKKGLWYLRDEYDKLEKLIKDKKLDFSSSSTTGSTSSDSESYSSYSEDGEEVETTQNMKNVQRTNLKNLQDQFDHLSVVTEETSAENSDLHSNRASLNQDHWTNCEDILKPDQSYPEFRSLAKSPTLPMSDNVPVNFFSPIRSSKSYDGIKEQCDEVIYPGEIYNNQFRNSTGSMLDPTVEINNEINNESNYVSNRIVKTNATNFYQNMVLVAKTASSPEIQVSGLEKSATDLLVKLDNQNFNDTPLVFSNTPSQSTFSNGGNLEELLQDIESISQISNLQKAARHPPAEYGYPEDSYYRQGENLQIYNGKEPDDRAFKSELNVVLVPKPMPLIGLDKYKNVQRSMENLQTKIPDDANTPQLHLMLSQPPIIPVDATNISNNTPSGLGSAQILDPGVFQNQEIERNPFFFGNFKDNYVNADHFSMRYNPDNFLITNDNTQEMETNKFNPENVIRNDQPQNFRAENKQIGEIDKSNQQSGSKTNLLDLTSSEHVSSENDEKLKSKTEKQEEKNSKKTEEPIPKPKSSKLSIRKKVSIHLKGKKEKNKLSYSSDSSIPKTPNERRSSILDVRFNDKDKIVHQKTPSLETQKSITETNNEPKTPSSSESKNSSDKKSDKKETGSDKKSRKSTSISPDRKHVQLKEEGQSKKHKKHRKAERSRQRRHSNAADQRMIRERSFSICTDRSNILEHRLGLGFGSNLYFDDFSDRERTNSLSSCDTAEHRRKMSTLPNVALSGKVPWCGCWGNGCL